MTSGEIDYRDCPICGQKRLISERGLALHVKRKHPAEHASWLAARGIAANAGGGEGEGGARETAGEASASSAAPLSVGSADVRAPVEAVAGESSGKSQERERGEFALTQFERELLELTLIGGDEILGEVLGVGSGWD